MNWKFVLMGVLGVIGILAQPADVHAQIAIDVTAIQRLIELKNIVDKSKKQIGELQKSNTINNGTRVNTNALLETQVEIENLLRSADDFIKIAAKRNFFADMQTFEQYADLCQSPLSNYVPVLQWKQGAIHEAIEKAPLKASSGGDLYNHIFEGQTAVNGGDVHHLGDYAESKRGTIEKIYGLQTAMQKRKIQQALVYYHMADDLEEKAQAINASVKGAILGTPLRIQNKGLFQLASLVNARSFDDPFNFQNTYNDNAMANVSALAGGGITKGVAQNLAHWIYNNLGIGKGRKEIEEQVDEMQNRALADAWKEAMGSFQNGSGLDYGLFAGGQLPGGGAFGTEEKGLRLTTGERIANQKAAYDLYVQAAGLREKGDQLLLEATVRTPEQHYVDGIRERNFQRNALSTIKL
ncbi:hypothetical protein GCM10027347_60540 [Larkinella harenae]